MPKPGNESLPCEAEIGEIVLIDSLDLAKMNDELNKYGGCGYRVEGVFKQMIDSFEDTGMQAKFAFYLKRDETNKYEYAWFLARRPGEAQTLANNLAENGFQFKKVMTFIEDACSEATQKRDKESIETGGALGKLMTMGIDSGAVFLFERKAGDSAKKKEYRILDGSTGRQRSKVYQQILNDHVAKGFRPVGFWWLGFMTYNFVIAEKDETLKVEGDYLYSDIALGTDKALTRFAKSGYRLIMTGYDFSILHRISAEPLEITYKAVPWHQNLTKKFPAFLERGIVEVRTGEEFKGCDVGESEWFFISPTEKAKSAGGFQNKEYKLLTWESFADAYETEKGWLPRKKIFYTDAQLQEVQNAFNNKVYETVKEGYEIKVFSASQRYSILLERRRRL